MKLKLQLDASDTAFESLGVAKNLLSDILDGRDPAANSQSNSPGSVRWDHWANTILACNLSDSELEFINGLAPQFLNTACCLQ